MKAPRRKHPMGTLPPGTYGFLVSRVVRADESGAVLEGRCTEGALALAGDFVRAVALAREIREGEAVLARRGDERPVHLAIASIEAYGREWHPLTIGMTARLTLIGEGGCCLRGDDLLEGERTS